MAKVALPSILQQSTVSIGMMLVQSVVNSFGSQMLAGYSAAMRIESVCIVPMSAMGNAISSYTAQNIGAGRQDRVRAGYRVSYGIVFALAAAICLVVQLLAGQLISLFLEDGSTVAFETGMACTRFMAWFYALIGLKMISDGVLRGAGDMTMFTVANLVNLGGDPGPPVRHPVCVDGRAHGLAGQLPHLFLPVPHGQVGQAPQSLQPVRDAAGRNFSLDKPPALCYNKHKKTAPLGPIIPERT